MKKSGERFFFLWLWNGAQTKRRNHCGGKTVFDYVNSENLKEKAQEQLNGFVSFWFWLKFLGSVVVDFFILSVFWLLTLREVTQSRKFEHQYFSQQWHGSSVWDSTVTSGVFHVCQKPSRTTGTFRGLPGVVFIPPRVFLSPPSLAAPASGTSTVVLEKIPRQNHLLGLTLSSFLLIQGTASSIASQSWLQIQIF